MDQWINHAAKFAFMFADKVTVPLVVRTPMGGKRGCGATHSQGVEWFGGTGLSVARVAAVELSITAVRPLEAACLPGVSHILAAVAHPPWVS